MFERRYSRFNQQRKKLVSLIAELEMLKKLGVDRALARAGAVQGDTVRIGRFEFEYEEDE